MDIKRELQKVVDAHLVYTERCVAAQAARFEYDAAEKAFMKMLSDTQLNLAEKMVFTDTHGQMWLIKFFFDEWTIVSVEQVGRIA